MRRVGTLVGNVHYGGRILEPVSDGLENVDQRLETGRFVVFFGARRVLGHGGRFFATCLLIVELHSWIILAGRQRNITPLFAASHITTPVQDKRQII